MKSNHLTEKERHEVLDYCASIIEPLGLKVKREMLLSNSRDDEAVLSRALHCVILRQRGMSLAKIAGVIDGDHANVHYYLNKYEFKGRRNMADRFIKLRGRILADLKAAEVKSVA